MVSNFLSDKCAFYRPEWNKPLKQKNLNNSKTIITILMKLYLRVALTAENIFTKFQIFMTSCW